jgi:hypothetical protein
MRKSYRYEFTATNQDGQVVVVASVPEEELMSYSLIIPMRALYKHEVSYVLDREEWDADAEDNHYYVTYEHNEFLAGNTPKLVSWWVASLPGVQAHYRSRRELWTYKYSRAFTQLVNKLLASLRSRFQKVTHLQ